MSNAYINRAAFEDKGANYKSPMEDEAEYGPHSLRETSSYSSGVCGNSAPLKALIEKIKCLLKKGDIQKPDYLITVGNSGLGIGSPISLLLDIPMWHQRNSNATRHSILNDENNLRAHRESYPNLPIPFALQRKRTRVKINGKELNRGSLDMPFEPINLTGKTYWFVDDLISSGLTYRRAIHAGTVIHGMRLSGIILTFGVSITIRKLKELAFLNDHAPLFCIAYGKYYSHKCIRKLLKDKKYGYLDYT